MFRPHLTQGLRLAIGGQFLQPPYLVVPDVDAVGGDRKSLCSNAFHDDPARVPGETVERAAARVVRIPASATHVDAVDAGRELRRAAAEQTEPDQSAQEAAHERLRRRLRA